MVNLTDIASLRLSPMDVTQRIWGGSLLAIQAFLHRIPTPFDLRQVDTAAASTICDSLGRPH